MNAFLNGFRTGVELTESGEPQLQFQMITPILFLSEGI